LKAYEEELKNLELKFDLQINSVISTRNEKMKENKSGVYTDFWLRVLTNHKILNNMITDKDRESLKFISDIRYEKLDDGNVFIINY
jgi:hypothetical protein